MTLTQPQIDVLLFVKCRLERDVADASKALRAIPVNRSHIGLVSEESKTPLWHSASKEYNRAFLALKLFNGKYLKIINKETRK